MAPMKRKKWTNLVYNFLHPIITDQKIKQNEALVKYPKKSP